MNKISVFSILLLLISTPVFAGSFDLGTTDVLTVESSNDVSIVYGADTTSDGSTFTLGTYHGKGTRAYMSSSEDSVIYWGDYKSTDTVSAPAAPLVGTSVGATTYYDNRL